MKSAERVNKLEFLSDHFKANGEVTQSNLFADLQDEIPFLGPTMPVKNETFENERPFIPEGNKWTNEIASMAAHTPDFRQLKNGKEGEFLVLVCDNLQLGRSMNHLLQKAHFYGRGQTVYEGFVLKKTREGLAVPFRMSKVGYRGQAGWAYPNKMVCMRSQDVGAIEGDVYGVPLRHLTLLDRLQGNTVKSNRQRNMIQLSHPRQKGRYAKAFLWEGDHTYYDKANNDVQFMSSFSMKIKQNVQVVFN